MGFFHSNNCFVHKSLWARTNLKRHINTPDCFLVATEQCLSQFDAGVLGVEQHLEQDGHINENLDRTADPELSRTFM